MSCGSSGAQQGRSILLIHSLLMSVLVLHLVKYFIEFSLVCFNVAAAVCLRLFVCLSVCLWLYGIALHCKLISELRTVTCHRGSHSVTCHLTQVNVPRLNPSHAGRYLICLPRGGWKAELTLVVGYIPRWFTCPQTVTHPGTNHLATQPGVVAQWLSG